MSRRSEPAFVEIVERVPKNLDVDKTTGGYIKPNEVRINGVPLVTLTLFARRVVVGAEHSDTEFHPPGET